MARLVRHPPPGSPRRAGAGGEGEREEGEEGEREEGEGEREEEGEGCRCRQPPSPGAPPGGARPPALSRRLPAAAPGEVPRVVRGFPLAVPAPGGNPKRPRREAGAALCGSGGASELAKRVSPPVSDPRRWRCASPPERRRLYRVVDRQGASRVFLARVGATGRCRVPVRRRHRWAAARACRRWAPRSKSPLRGVGVRTSWDAEASRRCGHRTHLWGSPRQAAWLSRPFAGT